MSKKDEEKTKNVSDTEVTKATKKPRKTSSSKKTNKTEIKEEVVPSSEMSEIAVQQNEHTDIEEPEQEFSEPDEELENAVNMPIVPIKGMVMMPGMAVHFDVYTNEAIDAMESAMRNHTLILVVGQKDDSVDTIRLDNLRTIGTIAIVKQTVRMPGKMVRVLTQGIKVGKLIKITKSGSALEGLVTARRDLFVVDDLTKEAMISQLRLFIDKMPPSDDRLKDKLLQQITESVSFEDAVTRCYASLPLTLEQRQRFLEDPDPSGRYLTLGSAINREIEIRLIQSSIKERTKSSIDKKQKEYALREQIKAIKEEIGDGKESEEIEQYRKKAAELQAPQKVRDRVEKEIKKLESLSPNSPENANIENYLDNIFELPWDKTSVDDLDLAHAREVLDRDHYGLEKVKDRIIEFLAVRALNQKGEAPIICLVGPPGTGKTSIARSVASALGKKYVRICLGGVRDEAEIRGHRRTYVSAMPGRLVEGLKEAGTSNPLMLLDEIDKVSSDYKGDVGSALLEVLDPEQNKHFKDHYIELPIDLSNVLFICTANDLKPIARPLLDRMEIIELSSYTGNEKLHIAKDFLYHKSLEKNGLTKDQLKINKNAMKTMIDSYTREAGVRALERCFGELCRKAAKEILEMRQNASNPSEKPDECIKITEKNLDKYLGNKKYTAIKANKKSEVGIVRGLAWTSVGGDTLQIEVNTMPGKGELILTGSLGEVMKESARIGLSFVRSLSDKYDIDPEYFDKNSIHVHVPAGATPKDGPSAGITMATAIFSAVTEKPVRADVAMTGEISLRGKVMPIGGLKEKLLAANKAGIKTVLIPEENERDLSEISEEITDGMKIVPVSDMQQVLNAAIER